MKASCLVISLLFSVSALAIRGGTKITEQDLEFKSTVGLAGRSVCSAVLIANDLALTATHCYLLNGQAHYITFGSNFYSPDHVRKIVGQKHFNDSIFPLRGYKHDLSIVQFEGGLPPGYQAAMIASEEEIARVTDVTPAGYGLYAPRKAGLLKKVTVKKSKQPFGVDEEHVERMLRLDLTDEKGACSGDSGGPFYITNKDNQLKVAAVLSVSDDSRGDGMPCNVLAAGTKIAPYLSWIEQAAKELRE